MFVNNHYGNDGCMGCFTIIGIIFFVICLMALCQGGG